MTDSKFAGDHVYDVDARILMPDRVPDSYSASRCQEKQQSRGRIRMHTSLSYSPTLSPVATSLFLKPVSYIGKKIIMV